MNGPRLPGDQLHPLRRHARWDHRGPRGLHHLRCGRVPGRRPQLRHRSRNRRLQRAVISGCAPTVCIPTRSTSGSYRASGVADMTFAVESHMDRIAHEIGMDPYDLRVKNALREGDVSVSGAVVPSNGLMETLEAIKEKIGLASRTWRMGTEWVWPFANGGAAAAHPRPSISINDDGTVSLLTGSTLTSPAATRRWPPSPPKPWGSPWISVIVAKRDTDLAPYTGQSGGSRIVYSQGTAVQRAAQDTVREAHGPGRRAAGCARRCARTAKTVASTCWITNRRA